MRLRQLGTLVEVVWRHAARAVAQETTHKLQTTLPNRSRADAERHEGGGDVYSNNRRVKQQSPELCSSIHTLHLSGFSLARSRSLVCSK